MDVVTVACSAVVSTIATIGLMIVFYSRWILPYLTKLTNSIPEQVRINIGPYIDEKMLEVSNMVSANIEDIKTSFKATSARFQRSINQAEEFLGGMDIDFTDEGQLEEARAKVARRYGVDIATRAIEQLLTSINAQKKPPTEAKSDGWD